jgi:hypothetical protein
VGIVDLKPMYGRSIGERSIGGTYFFRARKERRRPPATERCRDIGSDFPPALRRSEKAASERIKDAQFQVRNNVRGH